LTGIRDFLKSKPVELVGVLPETMNAGRSKELVDVCGMASFAPLLVAREKSVAIFSDDGYIKAIGELDGRTPSFCIQAFLRVSVQKNLILPAEYQDAVIKLLKSNYAFISEDASILKRCYLLDKGRITPFTLSLLNRVNDRQYNTMSCLPLMGEFAVFLWRNQGPDGANTREKWLREIWSAFSKSKDADFLILKFVANLAVACPAHPAVFFGIINHALIQGPFDQVQRIALFNVVRETIPTMVRISQEMHPFWVGLPKEWQMHQRINDILDRQGFLNNLNFGSFLPERALFQNQAKSVNVKSRKQKHRKKR